MEVSTGILGARYREGSSCAEPEARCLLRPGAQDGFGEEGERRRRRWLQPASHGDLIDEVRTVERP